MMKLLKILVLALFIPVLGLAQDVHFSQFYQAPLHLNPALTGVFNCTSRFSVNVREQWFPAIGSSRYSTAMVSWDQRRAVGSSDFWGVGLNFLRDLTGSTDFATTRGMASLSYSKYLGKGSRYFENYLSVGADASYVNRGIDFAKSRYGIQNTNGIYDESIPSGEDFGQNSLSYLDLSVGLLWFSSDKYGRGMYLGAAAHHINRPPQSFDDLELKLYTKYTIHGGLNIPIQNVNSINPSFVLLRQGPSFEVNAGASWRNRIMTRGRYNKAWQFGIWTRMVNNYKWADEDPESYTVGIDAIIAHFRFEIDQLNIGFSYDANVSDLTVANKLNNAFEFSLIYRICGPVKRNVYCPIF